MVTDSGVLELDEPSSSASATADASADGADANDDDTEDAEDAEAAAPAPLTLNRSAAAPTTADADSRAPTVIPMRRRRLDEAAASLASESTIASAASLVSAAPYPTRAISIAPEKHTDVRENHLFRFSGGETLQLYHRSKHNRLAGNGLSEET